MKFGKPEVKTIVVVVAMVVLPQVHRAWQCEAK